ncbi:MAG: endonuclease III domain-containing protein [Candidatus Hydrogenedentota bacterium]
MSAPPTLQEIHDRLAAHYGPTGWWPGESPFEIAVGAILTQNTAWANVERAIANLKAGKLLSPGTIHDCPADSLEEAIRPSGYFRVKAQRLRNFCAYLLEKHGGSMERMAREPLEALRPELLAVKGVGPETADDILLYACGKLVFVVDAYTRRILYRHGVTGKDIGYEALRELFETNIPRDHHLYKEYHGLIVWTGKEFCGPKPKCEACPLRPLLLPGQPFK